MDDSDNIRELLLRAGERGDWSKSHLLLLDLGKSAARVYNAVQRISADMRAESQKFQD
jgi:hypothetical protein